MFFSEFGSVSISYRAHAVLSKIAVDSVREVKTRLVFKQAA